MEKLKESFYNSWEDSKKVQPIKVPLTEKNNTISLRESKYPVLSAYKLPIWKLGQKNLNGRVYSESLGEKIVRENKVTISLDTHPEDNYEPKIGDIIAIGKNPIIENTPQGKVLFAECHFIDKEIAEKVDRAVEHGFMFEQSSSGFGELNEKNEVVVESYELERYFDLLVSDSSYAVSFGLENSIQQESINEKIETSSEEAEASLQEEKNKENSMIDNKTLSFEDKMIKKSINQSMKEASSIEDPKERLKELEEIATYFDDVSNKEAFSELLETVVSSMNSAKSEIEELAEKGKQVDSLIKEKEEVTSSVSELSEKVKTLEENLSEKDGKIESLTKEKEFLLSEMDKSKEIYNNLKTLFEEKSAELNTMVDPSDYVALYKENSSLEEKVQSLEESLRKEKKLRIVESMKRRKNPEKVEKVEESVEETSEEEEDFSYRRKHEHLRIETQSEEIREYYEDLRKVYGEAIEVFKKDFENCSTLTEASQCFFRHKPFLNEGIVPTTDSRRTIVDRFKEETISSKNKELNNRTSINIENCKADQSWI